jgi:hypothetical protein
VDRRSSQGSGFRAYTFWVCDHWQAENHAFFQASSHEAHSDIQPRVARVGSGEQQQEEDSDHDDGDEFVAVAEHVDESETDDEDSEGEDIFEDAREVGEETPVSSD